MMLAGRAPSGSTGAPVVVSDDAARPDADIVDTVKRVAAERNANRYGETTS